MSDDEEIAAAMDAAMKAAAEIAALVEALEDSELEAPQRQISPRRRVAHCERAGYPDAKERAMKKLSWIHSRAASAH